MFHDARRRKEEATARKEEAIARKAETGQHYQVMLQNGKNFKKKKKKLKYKSRTKDRPALCGKE